MFLSLCSFTKKNTDSVFPAFCHATFHHALIRCYNLSRAGYILDTMYPDRDKFGIHLILFKAM